jgi:hypothetical protein
MADTVGVIEADPIPAVAVLALPLHDVAAARTPARDCGQTAPRLA